jgi:hypothetical protein
MSTTTLILIAIAISLLCLAAMWLAQFKRQRTIERARKTVIYNAHINQLQQIVEATAQYLDDSLIEFLANRVHHNGQILSQNKITPDKRSLHTLELAQIWTADPKALRKQARQNKAESQQKCLILLKAIIQHIRQGVMEHQISRNEAKQLAFATKISKVKLSCNHYQQLADTAFKTGELQQGISLLKKLKLLLSKVSPLPNDLQQLQIECQGLIDKTQETLNEQNEHSTGKRLEEEFDKEEEQEQDWQKKQLYDQ